MQTLSKISASVTIPDEEKKMKRSQAQLFYLFLLLLCNVCALAIVKGDLLKRLWTIQVVELCWGHFLLNLPKIPTGKKLIKNKCWSKFNFSPIIKFFFIILNHNFYVCLVKMKKKYLVQHFTFMVYHRMNSSTMGFDGLGI